MTAQINFEIFKIDHGFCRVVYRKRYSKATSPRFKYIYYCLQQDGHDISTVNFYRCSRPPDCEPAYLVESFPHVKPIFEHLEIEDKLTEQIMGWISKLERG